MFGGLSARIVLQADSVLIFDCTCSDSLAQAEINRHPVVVQAKQKTLAAFVLAMMMNDYRQGQVGIDTSVRLLLHASAIHDQCLHF